MQSGGAHSGTRALKRIFECGRWVCGVFVLALLAVALIVPAAAAINTQQKHVRPKDRFKPRIVGRTRVGLALRATRGIWVPARHNVFRYRWLRCTAGGGTCRPIVGAVRSRYTPSQRDVGMTLRVTVTARNDAGSGRSTSRPTLVVPALTAPAVITPPTTSGAAQEGLTLTGSPGTWSGTKPIVSVYQWRRCDSSGGNCGPIKGATGTTYTLTSADVGSTLEFAVTASNLAGNTTASSAPSAVVGPPSPPGLVALWHMDETSGTTMVDSVGAHDGVLYSVQLGVPGFSGTAYGFNGSSSYAEVPSTTDLNPGSASITITIHINTTGTPPPPPADWDLIRKGYYASGGGEYAMELQQSGQASCTFKGSVGYIEEFKAGPALNDGRWHTVSCAKASSAVELVVDGQVYSTPITIGTIANTDPLVIGGHPGSEWTQGTLDEASIRIG